MTFAKPIGSHEGDEEGVGMLRIASVRLPAYAIIGIALGIGALASGAWLIGMHWANGGRLRQHRAEAGGLVCEEARWDFGVVDAVQTPRLTHDFVLTNESEVAVRIGDVRSSCGCMVASGYERALPPGAGTILTAVATLPSTPGPFNRRLIVRIEGADPTWLPLQVVASIRANSGMYTIPSEINFGTIPQGETRQRVVQVRRYDNSPVRIVEVIGSDRNLKCSLERAPSESDGSATIRVSLAGDALSPDTHARTITLRTQHEQFPELVVPVSAIGARPCSALVKSIVISDLSPGESRDVPLRQSADGSIRAPTVVSATYRGDPALSVELTKSPCASSRGTLRITREPRIGTGATILLGTVALRLQSSDETIDVPITVLSPKRD